jgi:uncharacterized glyoxalase superfamily protein PhnB
MDAHHTLNPFLAVKNADKLIQSYLDLLGGKLITRVLDKDGKRVAHAEVQIGDATIGLSETLLAGNYVWAITANVDDLFNRITNSNSDAWKVASKPQVTGDGKSKIMHATDLSNTTWIFQQIL